MHEPTPAPADHARVTAPAPATLTNHSPAADRRAGRWLGLASIAVGLPLAIALLQIAADPARQLLAPSGAMVWAAMLVVLLATVAVWQLARPGRRSLARGSILGLVLAAATGGGALAYGALAGPPAIAGCSASPTVNDVAQMVGRATVDGEVIGRLDGVALEAAAVTGTIVGLADVPIEDHGIERMRAVDARRCTVLVDGDTALAAMPPLRQLLAADRAAAGLPIWRGELEWWKSAQAELVGARLVVGGHPADAWPSRGLRGQLSGELWLVGGNEP